MRSFRMRRLAGRFRGNPGKSIKLSLKKNDWDEYVVNFYVNGKRSESKSYYTDDKEDAEDTLLVMADQELARGNKVTVVPKRLAKRLGL
jgi:hypothetical protein